MFGKMVGAYILLFLANLGILAFLVDVVGFNPYLGQFIASGSLMILAFVLQKFYVFRAVAART